VCPTIPHLSRIHINECKRHTFEILINGRLAKDVRESLVGLFTTRLWFHGFIGCSVRQHDHHVISCWRVLSSFTQQLAFSATKYIYGAIYESAVTSVCYHGGFSLAARCFISKDAGMRCLQPIKLVNLCVKFVFGRIASVYIYISPWPKCREFGHLARLSIELPEF
jgi:hypothetical protein